eukprot:PhM_4_TR388/c5_g1_i14/m.106729
MNNAPLLLALPKRSETNVVNANSISTSTSSSPRRHPTSAYSSPNASPRRLRRSPRRYNSSGSLDTGKCGNDDGDNDDDNVSCYSRASSCVSSVASSYAKNKSSSSNNTSKHQLRKPNPISLPRSSVATTSRDATTVGSPITPISPTTLRNSLSAMLMLGLGLRHACLNNVSADPPAKDTPHACYISLRPIAIGDYLRRFDKFAQCSDECYAVAAVLLDRWCAATGVQLHRSIVHKLTLTALVVALKMYDDQQYPMDWYAQVGGVETPELMALERRFLRTIAWRVVVGHDEYVQYVAIMRRAAECQYARRSLVFAGFLPDGGSERRSSSSLLPSLCNRSNNSPTVSPTVPYSEHAGLPPSPTMLLESPAPPMICLRAADPPERDDMRTIGEILGLPRPAPKSRPTLPHIHKIFDFGEDSDNEPGSPWGSIQKTYSIVSTTSVFSSPKEKSHSLPPPPPPPAVVVEPIPTHIHTHQRHHRKSVTVIAPTPMDDGDDDTSNKTSNHHCVVEDASPRRPSLKPAPDETTTATASTRFPYTFLVVRDDTFSDDE